MEKQVSTQTQDQSNQTMDRGGITGAHHCQQQQNKQVTFHDLTQQPTSNKNTSV